MSLKKGIFIFVLLILGFLTTVAILNRDKIVYVGKIKIVDVDCSKKSQILEEVYDSDQRIRRQDVPFKEFAREDHRNQELVISIIEKCGMPTLKEVSSTQMNAIWLALQHTEKKFRKKYFPLIEESVKNGDLDKQKYALMLDRIRMDEGKPQVYGSQIKNGKLYDLADPETVNERREEMGMESIESYLGRFNIVFKEAIK